MNVLAYLIPVALLFGLGSLVAFLWALKNGQYEDMDGAGERILFDPDHPAPDTRPDPANPPARTARDG